MRTSLAQVAESLNVKLAGSLQAGTSRDYGGFHEAHVRSVRSVSRFVQFVRSVADALTGGDRRMRRRRRECIQAVKSSPLFDEGWYLQTYPDVSSAKVDAATHFVDTGWREGRDPGPDFATFAYLKANPDVARTGINPLVHYIEFGKFEGRDVPPSKKRDRPATMPQQKFARPAPVFRGDFVRRQPIGWRRSYRLGEEDDNLVEVEGLRVGLAADRGSRRAVDAAFAQLDRLSGLDRSGPDAAAEPSREDEPATSLIDAWDAGGGVLRTRWQTSDYPIIVRAYQRDPIQGTLNLVAEAFAETSLDVIDVHLHDSYFPVLFVFADSHNRLRDARLLAFPSLCRGGLHYAELIAGADAEDKGWPDPLKAGLKLAARLELARRTNSPRIRHIAIDDSGDRSGPLFQSDFQQWLRVLFGVVVGQPDGADIGNGSAGAILTLSNDMVPTIAGLTGRFTAKGKASETAIAPVLIAWPDSSQPVLRIQMPSSRDMVKVSQFPGASAIWPRISEPAPEAKDGAALAIRFRDEREPTDSELLSPFLPAPERGEDETNISWALDPADWNSTDLTEALTALSCQSLAANSAIVFAGSAPEDLVMLAKRLFDGRVQRVEDWASAATALQSGYVGYLGPGIILHDTRTAEHLLGLLREPGVVSASCVLLTVERKGKTSHVAPADSGRIADIDGAGQPANPNRLALHLWRSCFPVKRPPHDLWLARAEEARDWLGSGGPMSVDGMHLCATTVSASYARRRSPGRTGIAPPAATNENSIRAGYFFG